MPEQFITCPNCGKKIPITEAFASEVEHKVRTEFEGQAKKLREEHASQMNAQEKEYMKRLGEQKLALEAAAQEQAKQAVAIELQDLTNQVNEKAGQVQKARTQELKLLKQIRDVEDREKNLELEMQRKLASERKAIRDEASKKAQEDHQLKDAEKDKRINDLVVELKELQRKAAQGSQQTQGEVLELHIAEVLKSAFQFDSIEEVAKGVRGADVLQGVRNELGELCGKILWEAKNAKNWSKGWVQKLEGDQSEAKADVAVIVTTALPADIVHVGQVDGIWVADVKSAIGLATVLRQSVIQVAQARKALVGKNTKMDAIYNYLSGPEFRQRVESIVNAFTAMQQDLNAERRAMERAWAKREKQISRVIENTAHMYGDLQGMIGASLPEMKVLELPGAEESD